MNHPNHVTNKQRNNLKTNTGKHRRRWTQIWGHHIIQLITKIKRDSSHKQLHPTKTYHHQLTYGYASPSSTLSTFMHNKISTYKTHWELRPPQRLQPPLLSSSKHLKSPPLLFLATTQPQNIAKDTITTLHNTNRSPKTLYLNRALYIQKKT